MVGHLFQNGLFDMFNELFGKCNELFGMCNKLFGMCNELFGIIWYIQYNHLICSMILVLYFVNYIFANYIFCVGK